MICCVCGKKINKDQEVAQFSDGNGVKYTHVMTSDNKYDCDYRYMLDICCPNYSSNIDEIE